MRRDERGLSNGVQFTLLFPLAFLIFLGVLQWALLVWAESVALAAAQDGVRAVAVKDGTEEAGRKKAHAAIGAAVREADVEVRRTPVEATVTVRGQAMSVLPGFRPTVERAAHAPVERLTSD